MKILLLAAMLGSCLSAQSFEFYFELTRQEDGTVAVRQIPSRPSAESKGDVHGFLPTCIRPEPSGTFWQIVTVSFPADAEPKATVEELTPAMAPPVFEVRLHPAAGTYQFLGWISQVDGQPYVKHPQPDVAAASAEAAAFAASEWGSAACRTIRIRSWLEAAFDEKGGPRPDGVNDYWNVRMWTPEPLVFRYSTGQ